MLYVCEEKTTDVEVCSVFAFKPKVASLFL